MIETVQQQAVNMASGLKGRTSVEKCLEIGLETLERRREDTDIYDYQGSGQREKGHVVQDGGGERRKSDKGDK